VACCCAGLATSRFHSALKQGHHSQQAITDFNPLSNSRRMNLLMEALGITKDLKVLLQLTAGRRIQ